MMPLGISFGLLLMLMTPAEAQQNAALTGEPLIGALPKVNPFASEGDVQQGGALFQTHCSYCHGVHGEGGRGADLTAGEYRMGGSDQELFTTIRTGVPGSEMRMVLKSSRSERSEEHTSELQSLAYLVCRLLLEKKKEQ